MRDSLTFMFLCEGTSDLPLAAHVETLISRQGVGEVSNIARPGGGSVGDKLSRLYDEGQLFDLVVVHRDADAPDPRTRVDEVEQALTSLGVHGCAVVPVQMTEAWLLVDEVAIRHAVGRPSGQEPLDLPKLREIESRSDPKAILKTALITATGTTGRRRKEATRQWSTYRRILLERLDVDGPVKELRSWQDFVARLRRALGTLC